MEKEFLLLRISHSRTFHCLSDFFACIFFKSFMTQSGELEAQR